MIQERILVVEDEPTIRELFRICLENEGYEVVEAATATDALTQFSRGEWDLVFLDYRLPDEDGLAVLKKIREVEAELPVIFMTAHSSVDNAVAAMKAGAFDYLTKPLVISAILAKTHHALDATSLRRELRHARESMSHRFGYERIIGKSAAMQACLEMVQAVADSEVESVLLLGESGVGKNLIAQAIHYNSRRAPRPFVKVTCSALTETLLESELFGHEKGAFTDARAVKKGLCEMAEGGTLFLDEIGDMPPGLQAKLLGFLEDRSFRRVGGTVEYQVNVRVLAATNKDLSRAVKEKTFREDLFYRLNIMRVDIPPLRDRLEDVPLLTLFFLKNAAERLRKSVTKIAPEATAVLARYPWPGNIRELRNMIDRAMVMCKGEMLALSHFPPELDGQMRTESPLGDMDVSLQTDLNLNRHERSLIEEALRREDGNQSRAAKLLGISRGQLIYRLKKLNEDDGDPVQD